jgi:beta-glucosidase
MIKKTYGVTSPEVSEREISNTALAREAAREGFVLLKNDGALPLVTRKIALYGMGARKTVKGGTGSGEVHERYSVSIEEGLQNAGFTITTQKWLDDYDKECAESRQAWHDTVEKAVAGLQNPMAVVGKINEFPYRYPVGRLVSDTDITASDTDTAVYVIMRQAGEGHDRKKEPGDFELTSIERQNMEKVASAYAHTVVIINIGGLADLSFMDEIPGIDALVFFVQGGMEGGNALADVLSGSCSFSGKLADTWPMHYADIPESENYSYLNGSLDDEDYAEGIYVGYRYFDSFAVQPRYPFGFGLSYTNFEITTQKVSVNKTAVTVSVTVKNTGTKHSGKEVVQVYLSAPQGKLKKEYQRLAAFAKTETLAPGASQNLTLSFDLTGAASYDEETSAWVLEEGGYVLRVGNSSRDNRIAAVLSLPQTVVTEQCRPCCAPASPVKEIKAPELKTVTPPASAIRLGIDPAAFVTRRYDYTEPAVTEAVEEKALLDSLGTEEMAELLRGGDLQKNSKDTHVVLGAGGKTALSLFNNGIGNIVFSDGPAGINVMEQVKIGSDGEQRAAHVPERFNFGVFAASMKSMISAEGQDVFRYATAWPAAMLLAQSWNTGLVEQVGKAAGTEMVEFGVTLWLAPGMNIHRNPLCGRNFEYYSEDPLISGLMAAAMTRGVQRQSGIGTTIKHFACNNQEDNRTGVSSNVNERALREIYLRGFEIAVRLSQPLSVMTSYNRLNKTYTANRHDLCTDILRCEWGFTGMVMTDWGSCDPGRGKPELCAPAGNDLVMPGSENDREEILKLDRNTLRRAACRVLRVILQSRIYASKG